MSTGALTKRIESLIYVEDAPRDYIGASSIGSDCLRQIWYEFKNEDSEEIPNHLRRTWEIGKRLEVLVIDLLKAAGVRFEDYQIELSDPDLPYFRGHFDGLMENPYSILEVKTANNSSFNLFVKQGLKKWNPRYFAQVQAYMGMSEVNKAYILVLNKDNSALWDEKVDFDLDYYRSLKDKAEYIYKAVDPPPRINNSPMWFQCKMCKFRGVCHK